MAMSRVKLAGLAAEAATLAARTRHLTEIGKPIHSLALELAAEKANDPLRKLMDQGEGLTVISYDRH